MKLTEAQAKELGMVKDGKGNWVTKPFTEFVESRRHNAGPTMAQQRKGAKRTTTHEQSIASIRESCLSAGMSKAEADQFLRIGECRG
jgi:hypothetical protein